MRERKCKKKEKKNKFNSPRLFLLYSLQIFFETFFFEILYFSDNSFKI